MTSTTQAAPPGTALRSPGWAPLALGLLAVLLFACTVPMTRLANGTVEQPQLPPVFVAIGRAAIAGLCAAAYLLLVKARPPRGAQWGPMAGVVLGGVLLFPLGMGWAVRTVPASHAATLIGALPLCTAALAAVWLGQRPGRWFWGASVMGAVLVVGYAALSAPPAQAPHWSAADLALLAAIFGAALAYVAGARLSREMPSAHVISWALVVVLPGTLPLSLWLWPTEAVAWSAWAALAYVALASSWLGFFAWYAALARDALRVSQVQLLQPFASIAVAAALLGERLDAATLLVAGGVLLTVMAAQRR